MRAHQDLPIRPQRGNRRLRVGIIVAVVVIVVVLASLRTLATFFTDYLWFGSVHLSSVWVRLLDVKIGLMAVFGALFFVFLWTNLAVVDRLAPGELALGPEDELVRRYQRTVAPHAVLVRTVVAVVLALVAGSSALGQWQNYLLFTNGTSFGTKDPQFHKDIGFYVFKLPFYQFIIGWCFVSLVVITIVTLVAHYLNGGLRVQPGAPRVAPQVKAHLSVLLAFVAVVKGFGYSLQRFALDLATDGYRQGAGYTDVHARLPALTLLMWLSFAAAILLLFNIRRQGWALPIIAVGLWAFVAVVVGAIYPAVVQALRVNPAQNQLEAPYIKRNITATRQAFGITDVKEEGFAASSSLTSADITASAQSLDAVRLWDPELTSQTYTKLQAIRSYYTFNTLALDRYQLPEGNGTSTLTPAVVGVRQINDGDLPAQGWVNTHLQYTHGYGMIASPADAATGQGQPTFDISDVPPSSSSGAPVIDQPNVYFGVANPNGGDANYVVAETRESEIDFQQANGNNTTSHYHGSGGVQLSNFVDRLAFATRFGDLNLLISSQITSNSRVMFVRDITQMAQKAAPFLSYDSDPYPVLVNGQIDWILDAYTTTDNYPYSENADTTALPSNSGLQQTFNYVRNSVKVVVNAYSGKMTFYVTPQGEHDPILTTWRKAFPTMFTPWSKMPSALLAHVRYPEDIFTVQAAMYGRYHILNAYQFYSAANAWNISQSPGIGAPNQALPTTFTTNAQGQVVSTGQLQRMSPLYEVFALPGSSQLTYNLVDAFVPVSQSDTIQTLSGFMVAGSDPGQYGRLTVYATTPGQSIDGPALIDARISATQSISSQISLLNQNGSSVELGNVQMVPVGQSMLYFRPLYVESARNPVPQLEYVIVVYSYSGNSEVAMEPTLSKAIDDVFPGAVVPPQIGSGEGTQGTGSVVGAITGSTGASQQVQSLVASANAFYAKAQDDLKAGDFAAYGTDIASLNQVLQELSTVTKPSDTSSSSTTTTTVPGRSKVPIGGSTSTTRPKGTTKSSSSTTTTDAPGVAFGAR